MQKKTNQIILLYSGCSLSSGSLFAKCSTQKQGVCMCKRLKAASACLCQKIVKQREYTCNVILSSIVLNWPTKCNQASDSKTRIKIICELGSAPACPYFLFFLNLFIYLLFYFVRVTPCKIRKLWQILVFGCTLGIIIMFNGKVPYYESWRIRECEDFAFGYRGFPSIKGFPRLCREILVELSQPFNSFKS